MSSHVYIIDGHGLCYRAFYAVKSLTNSKGQPTNAVFGFCNILRKLLREGAPTHIAVCFDTGKKTNRQKKYADYKIQRQAMPDDLVVQMKMIHDVVEAFNFPIFELDGYEADDVMATLAKRYAAKGVTVSIVTEDKDMTQLISDHIKIYSARLEKDIGEADVIEKFGVKPSQIVDYIALNGDSSDNIPGVYGIGEVTARKLLQQYGSLENIYKNIGDVKPPKLQEKLIAGEQAALMSKELATLHPEVPLKADLDDVKLREPNRPALVKIFNDLEFRKFAQDFSDGEVSAPELFSEEDMKSIVHIQEDGKEVHIVYNLKALCKSGQLDLVHLKGKIFDVYLADYLLAGGQGKYHLPTLRSSDEGLKELYKIQKTMIKEEGIEQLFYDVEIPLTILLLKIEADGVKLDLEVLKELSDECVTKIAEVEDSLFKISGAPFNVNSPKQLSEILFEKLKLPVIKKTKTGYSTDEEVLTKLADKHPLPALILEYRQMAKLKSTYLDALPVLVDSHQRVHATFNQTGAETGRLSSNNPNLQNIPIRTELGKRIRKAFIAYQPGHVLLAADYSQIELRILAHLAGDDDMKKAFQGEGDVHRYTASLMFDINEADVDEQKRYAAKRINFGIIYGMSAFGLAKDLQISHTESQGFIDRYFLRYPKVQDFLKGEIQKAKDTGYVATMFHRRRYLPDINNRNMGLRQFAERQAINAPMQGTAADLIKLAMVNIQKRIVAEKLSSVMIMTVHDELVFDVPNEELKTMVDLVRFEMEHAMEISVPLKASVKVGKNWLEMEKIKE